jgi:hypothetical protein
MPSGSSTDFDQGPGENPFEFLLRRKLQGEAELKAQELADRAQWEQARTMAQIYKDNTKADTALRQQQMLGQQQMERLGQSTQGIGFGREQLASQQQTAMMKQADTMANIRAMAGQRMQMAEMNAATRGGQQLGFPDFMQWVWPKTKDTMYKGLDPLSAFQQAMNQVQNTANPVRSQFMQRQQSPPTGGPPMMSPHQQPQAPAPQQWNPYERRTELTPEDYFAIGLG